MEKYIDYTMTLVIVFGTLALITMPCICMIISACKLNKTLRKHNYNIVHRIIVSIPPTCHLALVIAGFSGNLGNIWPIVIIYHSAILWAIYGAVYTAYKSIIKNSTQK